MKRLQSISEREYFKTVVVAHSREQAEKIAFWLTSAECVWRGNFYKSNSGSFLAYCRWHNNPINLPTTVYADAMIIYVESTDQLQDLSNYIISHRGIVNKIVLSDLEDFSEPAKTFKASWMIKPDDAETLRNYLLDSDHLFMAKAKSVFDKFDINSKGHVSFQDIESVSNEIGDSISSEDVFKLKELLNLSTDGLSFENFIIWWKLGKQNTFALRALIHLENLASHKIFETLEEFIQIKEELHNLHDDEENISNHHLKLHSGGILNNPGFEFLMNVYLGSERTDACINYLKQWTTNFNSSTGIFLDFDFKFDETVTGAEVKRIIEEKIDYLQLVLEALPDVKNFINTFFIIEKYANINSGKLTFRLKVDAEGLLKKHLKNIFSVFENIFHNVSQHFQIHLKTQVSAKDVFNNNLNGFQVLEDYELNLKIRLMRDHLRLIATKAPLEIRNLMFVLTGPSSVDINIKNDFSRAAGPRLTPILETPLGFVHELLQMAPMEMIFGKDMPIIRKLKEVQIALNTYFLFSNIKLHVEGLLDD